MLKQLILNIDTIIITFLITVIALGMSLTTVAMLAWALGALGL